MLAKRLLIMITLALFSTSTLVSAKSLLEKSIYFINPETSKIDSTKYWKVFMGSYPATLVRKFNGQDSLPVNTELNLTILSSGYIEGYGYSSKGRIDCMAMFVVDTGKGPIKVAIDSIDYIILGGEKVKPKNMPLCNLSIDVENNKMPTVKKLLLTKYKLVIDYDERNLKPAGDALVSTIAFSKAALLAAQKAEKEAPVQK